MAMLLIPAVAVAATSFTWTGEGAFGSGWSNASNWEGGVAPSGAVETLTFPELESPMCAAIESGASCYQTENDLSGLNVERISVFAEEPNEIDVSYTLTGEPITLGAGGLEDFLGGHLSEFGMRLDAPITLSAPQRWSLVNEGEGGENPLDIDANVSSVPAATLGLFSDEGGGDFDVNADIETGPIEAEGESVVFLGGANLEEKPAGELNATDGQPVTLGAEALLVSHDGETGPLTAEGALFVGNGSEAGTLSVDGAATFTPTGTLFSYIRHAGTVAGADYSRMTATGAVELDGAQLHLEDGFLSAGEGAARCETLKPGDVDTLIETSGSLTGTFVGVPDGAMVPVVCDPHEESPTVRINYTAHAVTATVLTGGNGEKAPAGGGGGEEGHSPGAQTTATSTTATATTPPPTLTTPQQAPPVPVLARTGDVAPVSGRVLVRRPGTSTFVALSSLTEVPFGVVVDATHGSVAVTTAGTHGTTQTITLSEGEFVLAQGHNGMVVATLTGGDFSICPAAQQRAHTTRAMSARAKGKHVVRKLWAEGHGNFTTEGNYASASVRGTRWLTEDFCEGTLIRVATDRVAVVNRVTHRRLIVKAGHSYLAKAP